MFVIFYLKSNNDKFTNRCFLIFIICFKRGSIWSSDDSDHHLGQSFPWYEVFIKIITLDFNINLWIARVIILAIHFQSLDLKKVLLHSNNINTKIKMQINEIFKDHKIKLIVLGSNYTIKICLFSRYLWGPRVHFLTRTSWLSSIDMQSVWITSSRSRPVSSDIRHKKTLFLYRARR